MERKPTPTAAPQRRGGENRPQGGPGRSGRGSASALEAWKKAEQARVPRARDPEPGR